MRSFSCRTLLWSLMLLMASLPIAHAQTEDSPPANESRRSLADLGYPQGLQQQSNDGTLSFFMPVPRDVALRQPRLVLRYAASPLLGPHSSMQVSVNGTPRLAVGLGGGAAVPGTMAEQEVVVPLNAADLRRPFVDVRVDSVFAAAASEQRCDDERGQRGFLVVLPETALVYALDAASVDSVRGYLDALPGTVRIAAARPAPSADQLRAMWLLARELETQGRTVVQVGVDEPADIYIGPRAQLALLGFTVPAGSDLALLAQGGTGTRKLVVADPFRIDAIGGPWGKLLSASAYGASSVSAEPAQDGDRIALSRLGLDGGERVLSSQAEWYLNLDSPVFAPGRIPKALQLNLVGPPSPRDNPLLLYVFQNDVLRGVRTLSADGGAQSVTVPLIEAEAATRGSLRILVKRQSAVGDCRAPRPQGHMQLLASSTLETTTRAQPAESFNELGRWLAGGYAIHLPAAALAEPQAWARVLTVLTRELGAGVANARLVVGDAAPADATPFLWMLPQAPAGFDSPLAADKGRLQVKDGKGHVLLDSDALPGIAGASLLRDGNRRGLWLRSLDGGVPQTPLALGGSVGDLAFIDGGGVVLSIDSRQNDVAQVTYPDYQSWMDRLAGWKPWLFALAWVVLTVLVIAAVRRLRRREP